jgi:hypothetical protein
MRTYPLYDKSGAMFAFEVDNWVVSPRRLSHLVRSGLGAVVTQGPRGFFSREDWRLRFLYAGVEFEVWEPFGDNSRYWIGPVGKSPQRTDAIDDIHNILANYKPTVGQRLLSLVRA